MTKEELRSIGVFLAEYVAVLLGSGVHTSRATRNTKRLAQALGVDAHVTTLMKTLTLTVKSEDAALSITEVVDVGDLPIKFYLNSELSALSWDALDKGFTLEEVKQKYEQIVGEKGPVPPWLIVLLISMSNACFCRLFGGDFLAMSAVFIGTGVGFSLRRFLTKTKINFYIATFMAAFSSAAISSLATLWHSGTPEIALAASVLYLIPGVPLINGTIDIIESHTLTGISRFVKAALIIICLAAGMAVAMLWTKSSL